MTSVLGTMYSYTSASALIATMFANKSYFWAQRHSRLLAIVHEMNTATAILLFKRITL